jgi:hypothetical protein
MLQIPTLTDLGWRLTRSMSYAIICDRRRTKMIKGFLKWWRTPPTKELLAGEGLLMGWCLFNRLGRDAVLDKDSQGWAQYQDDLEVLLKWFEPRRVGDITTTTYEIFKGAVMREIKSKLENIALLSRSKTSMDVFSAIRMNHEWIRVVESFSLTTPEETVDIANLGAADSSVVQRRPTKAYRPIINKAAWTT